MLEVLFQTFPLEQLNVGHNSNGCGSVLPLRICVEAISDGLYFKGRVEFRFLSDLF